MPVPRLDLQSRRFPGPCSPYGKSRRIPRNRLSAEECRRRRLGWPYIHQSFGKARFLDGTSCRTRPQVPTLGNGRTADGGTANLSFEGELEAHRPELFRVSPLPHRPSPLTETFPLHERCQRASTAHLFGRADGFEGR